MDNIKQTLEEYYNIRQQIKELEKKADDLYKPLIKQFYKSSGVKDGEDLKVEGFFINIAQALKETFDLKKARTIMNNDMLEFIQNTGLIKKTQYPIVKVDVKPIANKDAA